MVDRENYDDYDVILTLKEVENIRNYELWMGLFKWRWTKSL